MQLTLRYHDSPQRPAAAAFLRGTDAAAWLREIGRWQLPAEQLSCYLVPESIRSVRPAGLLVVAAPGALLPADLLEPYGVVAGRLYVPTRATLWPPAAPGELEAALLWPRQLWHPAIGLVGFEAGDELNLASLLDCPAPRPADWSRARSGPAPKARLQQIRVQAPTAAEVVQGLRAEVGTVPLAELPRPATDQPDPARRLLEGTQRQLLRAGLAVVGRLQRLRGYFGSPQPSQPSVGPSLPAVLGALLVVGLIGVGLYWLLSAFSGNGQPRWEILIPVLFILLFRVLGGLGSLGGDTGGTRYEPVPPRQQAPGRPGALDRLGGWLGGHIRDLERKRNNELDRLLRLFGENMEEALRYAIPLGGPYQDRGTAPASATLGPRDTNFSLSGLGGGGAVDSWDLGQYHLRRRYQEAAEQEAQARRYHKAAYIHAHLLADYAAAARVLEQGGLFRQAAALYQEHLHNRPAAAECLERGGLLLEAAELYAKLKQHEKAGDLYQQLDQSQLACRHYERGVEELLGNQDHPAAARLLAGKLRAPDRAQQVLLQGWAGPKQPEVCLQQYFEVVAATPGADLSTYVREVYQRRTPPGREVLLLGVLATAAEQHPDPELQATAREVAYEVVGAEAAAGNHGPLALLRRFLPEDRLIATDCSRYISRRPAEAAPAPRPLKVPQLDASIAWRHAVAHAQQWVAVGVRDERLHLARGNWAGNVEYYSWMTPVPAETIVQLLADEAYGNRIVLRLSAGVALEPKLLPQNRYFPAALRVECPSWLPPWPTRVALLPDGGLATARLQSGYSVLIQRYAADGRLLAPLTHELRETAPDFAGTERNVWPCEMLYHQGTYYTYYDNWLVALGEDGHSEVHQLDISQDLMQLVRSAYAPELTLASVSGGALIQWTPGRPPVLSPQPDSWENGDPTDLSFVGPDHLVVFSPEAAYLYYLGPDEQHLLQEFQDHFAAALPTSHRGHFVLLTAAGALQLHSLAGK